MVKIYVSHSNTSNFKQDLYAPLRQSELNSRAEIIFPHEKSTELYDSKTELKTCQWVIAEVSQPSFGVGIELGWASLYQVPVIAIHKIGTPRYSSVEGVAKQYLEYESSEDLISLIMEIVIN